MTWYIGKCRCCGEPRGPYAATVFKVRVLRRFLFWKRRVWSYICDECSIRRDAARRERVRRARLRRLYLNVARAANLAQQSRPPEVARAARRRRGLVFIVFKKYL